MKIDLTCPAEVFRAVLPTAEIPAVTLTLFNLSDRVIVSAEACVRLEDKNGGEREKVVYRARALNGRPHSTFPMVVPCTFAEDIKAAEVTLEKIWFNDNAVWRRDPRNTVEYTPNTLPVSRGLTNLKYAAGETAVGYPSQQDGLWVCVCGRPNPDNAPVCDRCRRDKNLIFTRFNREAVEKQLEQRERQLELNSRNVLEDTARLQRIREEEYNRKKRRNRTRRRLALTGAATVLFTAALVLFGIPGLRLWSANKAIKRGEYAAAKNTLTELNGFGKAEDLLAETELLIAEQDARESEDPEILKAASQALRAAPEREGAADLALQAETRRARVLLDQGDYEAALEAAATLPEESEERTAIENACDYAQAKADFDGGYYVLAREGFLALGDYEDAQELASRCLYDPAVDYLEKGELDAALTALSQIPDYKDSRELIKKIHYMKGEELEATDLAGAAAEYQAADDYPGAAEKMQACTWEQAEEAFRTADFETAEKLYLSLGTYKTAEDRAKACTYTLAKRAFNATEYATALERLDTLPDNYEDVPELREKAAYLAGMDAMGAKNWTEAIRLLERVTGYKDADDQLKRARYEQAGALLEAGDGAGAKALLSDLGDYKKTGERMLEADYLIAVGLAEKGSDPDAAIEALEALGDYKDAKERLKALYYTKAQEAEALTQTLPAARLYDAAGDYANAKEKAAELYDAYYGERTDAVRNALDAGEYGLALTLLESMDRENLPEKYKALEGYYQEANLQTAERLFAEGKVYEALPYYRAAGEDARAQERMESPCYLILGTWESRTGEQYLFREDGSCRLKGAEYRFELKEDWLLRLCGKDEDDSAFRDAYRITSLTDRRMSLREMREEEEAASVYLIRVQEDSEE